MTGWCRRLPEWCGLWALGCDPGVLGAFLREFLSLAGVRVGGERAGV